MIVFFLFGLSIAAFLFLLLLLKRNKNNSDYILATWMGFMTLHLALFVLNYSQAIFDYPHLLGVILPLPILHGTFLYLYTLEITTNRLPGWKAIVLHLMPFSILVFLAIPFYLLSAKEKVQVFLDQGRGYEWYSFIQLSLFIVVGLAYSIASIVRIRTHRREMLNVFSSNEKKMLKWLEWMALGLGIIWLLVFLFDDQVIFSGVVLFILFIGAFGINQTPVFFTSHDDNKTESAAKVTFSDDQTSEKYQKSGLTDNDATRVLSSLEAAMKTIKPFRNPDLTLDELAGLVKVSPYQLSQVINSRIGKTFYHYINSYRIKEFLLIAASPESSKFTYLGLATDCGFQSKSTFNKYFKLETGKTPSEYFQVASAA